MGKLLKAGLVGAGLYATMKLGEVVGFWKGTLKTAMLYGADRSWGHEMVDRYADLYEKERKA